MIILVVVMVLWAYMFVNTYQFITLNTCNLLDLNYILIKKEKYIQNNHHANFHRGKKRVIRNEKMYYSQFQVKCLALWCTLSI